MILIGLQKANDTIDHKMLLKKMKYLGFSKNAVAWFKSYHCERKFKMNTSYSIPSSLLCGVSRGSNLGLLLFILYINDLPQAVSSDLLLYTDDTYVAFQHESVIYMEKQLIRDFSSLCDCRVLVRLETPRYARYSLSNVINCFPNLLFHK